MNRRSAILLAAAGVAVACAQGADIEAETTWSGYIRIGFEQSDFYPGDGGSGGPWWVTMEETARQVLAPLARGEGRGRMIVATVTVRGRLMGPVDFGFRAPFENSLHIVEVTDARPASDEEFQVVVQRSREPGRL